MAATWKQSITTSAGISLMNKAYGVSSIIPTKAVTITDNISGLSVTQVMALTSVNYNQSRVPIVISNQANTTRIGIDIDNKDVNEQYDYFGIGVYFKQVNTGEEVLFSVIPLSGAATIIPNQSGVATSSISIDSYTSIVPGTNVDLTVSESGTVTRGDVEKIVAANQSFSFPKKPLATGIDLQSIKSIGIYQVNDDKTVVNAPDSFSGNGYLIVVGDGTTANPITQDLFDTVTGNKYSNSYDSDGNKWTGWKEMASKSDIADLNNGLSTKVTDNKNGTIQVNGTQVNPYNKLTDSVGGRNLAPNTNDNWQKVSSGGWGIANLSNPIYEIKDGETYTLQVEVRNMTSTIMLETFNFTAAGARNGLLTPHTYTSDDTKIIVTFTAKLPENYSYFQPNLAFPNSLTSVGSYEYRRFKLEQGSVATDWAPAPEDKVNVADMRKPASDVAGIEEVNAKQDKIGYTPADDSKVVHTADMRKPANQVASIDEVNVKADDSKVSTLQTQVDNLQVGGQNYLLNSATFSPNWSANLQAKAEIFELITEAGVDNTVLHIKNSLGNAAIGLYQYPTHKFEVGEAITQSVMVRGHGQLRLSFYGMAKEFKIDSDTYIKIYLPGIVTNTNNAFTLYVNDIGEIWCHSPKVETGSLATDWGPNPEEILTKSDDSKVAHLSGANNFDTVPTVNNNPLLLASSLPSDLARTGQDANFTGKLQQNGQDVALANNTIARDPNTGKATDTTDFPYKDLTVDGYPVIPFVLVPDRATAITKTAQYPNYAFMYGKELS